MRTAAPAFALGCQICALLFCLFSHQGFVVPRQGLTDIQAGFELRILQPSSAVMMDTCHYTPSYLRTFGNVLQKRLLMTDSK